MLNTVFVAGYGNSIDGHWQQEWQKTIENSYWVEQKHWHTPNCSDWVEALDRLLETLDGPILLVTHSLGGSTLIEWNKKVEENEKANEGKKHHANIIGAFMVAVPDVLCDYFPAVITGYQDLPLEKLPFPSMYVASTDDSYASIERAEYFAKCWGSALINVGNLGHINANSNIAQWSDGLKLLNKFKQSLGLRNV